jgi:NADH dehydrogenase
VHTVVSTVSTTISRQPGDSIPVVDNAGQVALVDAAKAAGVARFVLLSFPEQSVTTPLEEAKRAVEQRMIASGMGYTILRPPCFMDVWLSPALGFDYAGRRARILGSGNGKQPWIAVSDVVAYVVGALDSAKAKNATLPLGGPDALSVREVVRIFEEAGGAPFELDEVPEAALEAQYKAATDPLEKSFAGLMLTTARGITLDLAPGVAAIPIAHRTSVREYAKRVLS